MLFHEYLNTLKEQQGLKTSKALFEFLGGEKELGFKYRRFYNLENGIDPPTVDLLVSVFNRAPVQDKNTVLKAFFYSRCKENKKVEPLLNFLESRMDLTVQSSNESIWKQGAEKKKEYKVYSDQQLDYLATNEYALRLHKNLLLYESVSGDALAGKKEIIEKLIALDLAKWDGKKLVPARIAYRIPQKSFAPPKSVAKANNFALKHVETYMSTEGASNQQLFYFSGLFKPDAAKQVLDQTACFKNWVQVSSSWETTGELKPVVFFVFAKALEGGEL